MTVKQAEQIIRQAGAPLPAFMEAPKANKLNARKKLCLGVLFASAMEARAYQVIKQWEAAGAITELELQPKFVLQEKYRDRDGKCQRAITYKADFAFQRPQKVSRTIVEVKGFCTESFRIRERLFRMKFPDLNYEIWDASKVKELCR